MTSQTFHKSIIGSRTNSTEPRALVWVGLTLHFASVGPLFKTFGRISLNAGTSSTTKSTARSPRDMSGCPILTVAHNKLRNAESMTVKMASAALVATRMTVACSGMVVASAKSCSAVSMRATNITVKDIKTSSRTINKDTSNRTLSTAHSELASTARSPAARQNGVITSPLK
jgi:hypothetical protein